MIEINQETLIPLAEVPRRLPPRPSGRMIHISAVYRWVQRGVRGVRLEAIRVGGTTYTSIEALQRFAACSSSVPPQVRGPSPSGVRRHQSERAADQVHSLWSTRAERKSRQG